MMMASLKPRAGAPCSLCPNVFVTFPSQKISRTPCEKKKKNDDYRRLPHFSLFKLLAQRGADLQVRGQ